MLAVEMLFAAPVVLLATALVTQASWTFFQTACFDQALAQMPSYLERNGTEDAGAEEVHAAIVEHWTPIDSSRVRVEDATVRSDVEAIAVPTEGPFDRDVFLIEQASRSQRRLSVQARVSYEIPPLVPIPMLPTVTIERVMDRSILSNVRFEVF